MESGAYYKPENDVKALKLADYQINTSKKRRFVQIMSPIPLVPGKATVVIKGEHSSFTLSEKRPEFYLRLAKEEKFGIIKSNSEQRHAYCGEYLDRAGLPRECGDPEADGYLRAGTWPGSVQSLAGETP